MPLAPLRLSTITVWPSASPSFGAISRAIKSTAGPGGVGTTRVIGLAAGQLWAAAGAAMVRLVRARRTAQTGLIFVPPPTLEYWTKTGPTVEAPGTLNCTKLSDSSAVRRKGVGRTIDP